MKRHSDLDSHLTTHYDDVWQDLYEWSNFDEIMDIYVFDGCVLKLTRVFWDESAASLGVGNLGPPNRHACHSSRNESPSDVRRIRIYVCPRSDIEVRQKRYGYPRYSFLSSTVMVILERYMVLTMHWWHCPWSILQRSLIPQRPHEKCQTIPNPHAVVQVGDMACCELGMTKPQCG